MSSSPSERRDVSKGQSGGGPGRALTRRLDLRLAEDEKNEIDRAAALAGATTSAFVRQTVLAAARETIERHATIRLTHEGGRKFVDAINNPPVPNAKLRALVQEFRRGVEE